MCPCKSLRLIAAPQHRFREFDGLGMPVSARGAATPRAGVAEVMVSASQFGSQSAVALGVATARCASWLVPV
jgi:hypothetical protein